MIAGTSPYITSAREGVYMPMKMEHPEIWKRTDDVRLMYRGIDNIYFNGQGYTDEGFRNAYHALPSGNTDSAGHAAAWLPPVDDNLGVIWFRGLATATSFRCALRIGLEMMTRPESSFASFAELPALPDPHAIAMYYEISSRMADAYPARDNADGSLWDKIKEVAGKVWKIASPILSMTPLAPFATLGNGIGETVNFVEGLVKSKKKKTPAQKEISDAEKVNASVARKIRAARRNLRIARNISKAMRTKQQEQAAQLAANAQAQAERASAATGSKRVRIRRRN
jgi:hypothetical protein